MYKSKLSALFLLAMLVAGPSYAQDYKIQALDKDLNPIEDISWFKLSNSEPSVL